jgi:hypothetical protein
MRIESEARWRGHAMSGPGFYVWQETRTEAERWAAALNAVAPERGPRREGGRREAPSHQSAGA